MSDAKKANAPKLAANSAAVAMREQQKCKGGVDVDKEGHNEFGDITTYVFSRFFIAQKPQKRTSVVQWGKAGKLIWSTNFLTRRLSTLMESHLAITTEQAPMSLSK